MSRLDNDTLAAVRALDRTGKYKPEQIARIFDLSQAQVKRALAGAATPNAPAPEVPIQPTAPAEPATKPGAGRKPRVPHDTVLDMLASGMRPPEVAREVGQPTRYVHDVVRQARERGDPRAPAPKKAAPLAKPGEAVVRDVEPERFLERAVEADEHALAALVAVHGRPENCSSLPPAPEAFSEADRIPLAAYLYRQRRGCDLAPVLYGDPPPGRSALDMRRAG